MPARLLAAFLTLLAPVLGLGGDPPLKPGGLPKGCQPGCGSDAECCCMHCSANGIEGPIFSCMNTTTCFQNGGQCKPNDMPVFTESRTRPFPSEPSSVRARAPTGPEQVHLIGGGSDEVVVVFVGGPDEPATVELRETGKPTTSRTITSAFTGRTYSMMINPTGWNGWDEYPHPGGPWAACRLSEHPFGVTNETCYYTSWHVYTVPLQGLSAETAYEYRPGSATTWREFRTPPAIGKPINLGLTADVGQTSDSMATMKSMHDSVKAGKLHALVVPGDMAYADGFGPAWDTWGRKSEFLFSAIPASFGIGNHEVGSGSENFASFDARYGWQLGRSGSLHYFSYSAGLAHVVMLDSYEDTSPGSAQQTWLAKDLAKVNRTETPWLVVAWHVPWYTTNFHHSMEETTPMRASMEPILHQYGADVVFTGHVHAYERTAPVYDNETRCDGAYHITIGDAGNHEGPACPWAQDQPSWSKYREFSFGWGILELHNATHGRWVWNRNQDPSSVAADSVVLLSRQARCQHTSTEGDVADRGAIVI